MSGRIVFAYSIANFPLLRCFEQLRNDACYHKANVKVVAVGGGLAYGSLGMSHHATEDIAVARSLPNLVVVAPNDPVEAEAATRAVAAWDGPCYFRLGRAGEARVSEGGRFALGRATPVREGRDLTLIVGAGMLGTVLKVADALATRGQLARVISVHTIKPLDEDGVVAAAADVPAVFTVEEHSRIGGLGSAVCEVLMERGIRPPVVKRIGLDDHFVSICGTQEYLRVQAGLDVDGIIRTIDAAMRQVTGRRPAGS